MYFINIFITTFNINLHESSYSNTLWNVIYVILQYLKLAKKKKFLNTNAPGSLVILI